MGLTTDQLKWSNKLRKLFENIPNGIDVCFSPGVFHILPEGWYAREIHGTEIDMMTEGGNLIDDNALTSGFMDRNRFHVNSESE